MIDINFDFRTDSPPGKDPDVYSKTLRSYHKQLWSKPLPNGHPFDLSDKKSGVYLFHESDLGEFKLSSDTLIPSYLNSKRMAHIINQVPEAANRFQRVRYTIGGFLLLPSKQVDGKPTINGARGMHGKIGDRFDLTLECIRRHYVGAESPIAAALGRYSDFFNLFGNFEGYLKFHLLEDMVDSNLSQIRFALPFDDFERSALPINVEEYLDYMEKSIEFINQRNQRINELSRTL